MKSALVVALILLFVVLPPILSIGLWIKAPRSGSEEELPER